LLLVLAVALIAAALVATTALREPRPVLPGAGR